MFLKSVEKEENTGAVYGAARMKEMEEGKKGERGKRRKEAGDDGEGRNRRCGNSGARGGSTH